METSLGITIHFEFIVAEFMKCLCLPDSVKPLTSA